MTIRNLHTLFNPSSVALIGASDRAGSLGRILLENVTARYAGQVYLVNPAAAELMGRKVYADVQDLPAAPDLAVIATPPAVVPDLVAALGAIGTRGVCVITAGFDALREEDGKTLRQAMLDAARPNLVRIVGPNCVGLQLPRVGLNASFASVFPTSGSIAFASQSGAVITAVLDWAYPRNIGFSHVVSLGDMADVDFGDMLDFLANDAHTSAILLYIEAVTNARKFLSAARAAARTKPVIVVKAGRFAAGARAAASHTGALAGSDEVYDAVFRRAGMLRVVTLEELFDVVETLATARLPDNERLTILTNGGGLGVLAADALMAEGGRLSELDSNTLSKLDGVLPRTWSRNNPVDIIGDANGERYAKALEALLQAPDQDALLILNCPTALASSDEVATAVMQVLPERPAKTILTSWTGEYSTREPRRRLQQRGIPTYDSPEDAVHAFMQMVEYRRNQAQLLHAPPSLPESFTPDRAAAQRTLQAALEQGRDWLSEAEAKSVLAAYGIAVVPTVIADSATAVAELASQWQQPLAVKILSPDITHKSDVGGVELDVAPAQAGQVAAQMQARVAAARPEAHLQGFTVQPMVRRPKAHELILGMVNDHQFGPVIMFGHGGTAVEVLNDKALALPPLNLALARELMQRTRIYRLLQGYRNVPPADLDALAMTLVRLSHLVVDLPEITEIDINPLLADADGAVALDARIRLERYQGDAAARLAIRPYPTELEQSIETLDGCRLMVRPIVPEDQPHLAAAFAKLPALASTRLTQIDYDRQMVLVISPPGIAGQQPIHAAALLQEDPDRTRAVLHLAVAAGYEGRGLGSGLLRQMLAYAQRRGLRRIDCEVPSGQAGLARLCAAHGFVSLEDRPQPSGLQRLVLQFAAS